MDHDGSLKRGIHDIEHEITYPSNPDFVFHDSMGFEAGSADELEKVQAFIMARSAKRSLRDQLHAIWYVFVNAKNSFPC